MTKRTDSLLEARLTNTIADLQRDMTEFKTAQRTSGKTNIIGYLTQSASTWDATGTIGTDASSATITSTFSVTFTGDGTQSTVMANLSFLFYVNGTDTAHQLTPLNNSWSDGAGGHFATLQYGSITETATTYTQPLTLFTNKAITYYVKAYAVGSSGGTVTVVKTS